MNNDTEFVFWMVMIASIMLNLYFGAALIYRRAWDAGRIEGRAEAERRQG